MTAAEAAPANAPVATVERRRVRGLRPSLAQVKTTLAPEGATEAALAYYPALFRLWAGHPEVAEKISGKTTVPTLAIFGEADKPRELSAASTPTSRGNSASRSSRARVISRIASNPNT